MEGPDEFADGLSYGARSLLGHVVGGTAGSVSLISSSLGDLLSSLSFDEDYKKVSGGPQHIFWWQLYLVCFITLFSHTHEQY
jgi:vacuolar protein sorting-associated protein 13A/C